MNTRLRHIKDEVEWALHQAANLGNGRRTGEMGGRGHLNEPTWYRGHYLLAVAFANVAQAKGRERSIDVPPVLVDAPARALGYARAVAVSLERRLDEIQSQGRLRGHDRALFEFLNALEPIVLLLFAGTVRRWGGSLQGAGTELVNRRSLIDAVERDAARAEDIIEYVRGLQLDYRARYNLACYYAGIGDEKRRKRPKKNESRTTEADHDLMTSAGDEPDWPESVDVERKRGGKHKPPSEYVHALSELAEALKTAPPDLLEWAQHDPSLAGLRDDEELGPRLEKLIKNLTPAKEAPPKLPGVPITTKPQ